MFNRVLQVRMVKGTRQAEPAAEPTNKEALYDSVANATNKVVKKVAMAALAYVAVDTARQVLVARAMNS